MNKILIFAGTTEGRILSEHLADAGISHTVCVATEYGEKILSGGPEVTIRQGRMNCAEMEALMKTEQFLTVVDATHPYAAAVTENIRSAARNAGLLYLRLKRREDPEADESGVIFFSDHEQCEQALEKIPGRILLTTGSKELSKYCMSEELRKRLYVRVLPGLESIAACLSHGIEEKQILALQGPFSAELNEALIRQFQISCLVTKKSGHAGGYQEKLTAARRAGIPVFVICPPGETDGFSFPEVCRKLETLCGKTILTGGRLHITLAGIGMGSEGGMTGEVREAIRHADILLGAERMIAPFQARYEKLAIYRAAEIAEYLKRVSGERFSVEDGNVVILFSGDTGFYSGCRSVCKTLGEEIRDGNLNAELTVLPGISSVSFLAARTGVNYEDAKILSMHGKELPGLGAQIRHAEKTFLLTSGPEDVRRLCETLLSEGLSSCEITAGYRLSMPDEKILTLRPEECASILEPGLYTCLIRNPGAAPRNLTHGLPDGVFLREKVPMTKEEVREVSICKLRLCDHAVVYDVGSGTGSVAVEIAGLSPDVKVYAVERKPEAVALIRANKEKFHLSNITVVETEAPEGFSGLPAPTHAFIGGSGGNMRKILNELYEKNSAMRIVVNAISVETVCEMREMLRKFPVAEEEIVQIQASRAKKAGSYHLMQAENPVWIFSFRFTPKPCETEAVHEH